MMATFLRTCTCLLLLCLLSFCLSGCRPSTPVSVVARPVSARTLPQSSSASDARRNAIDHVQSLPLYHQAQSACEQHHYKEAADLLERLSASPGLNSLEIAFCHDQVRAALADEHLF